MIGDHLKLVENVPEGAAFCFDGKTKKQKIDQNDIIRELFDLGMGGSYYAQVVKVPGGVPGGRPFGGSAVRAGGGSENLRTVVRLHAFGPKRPSDYRPNAWTGGTEMKKINKKQLDRIRGALYGVAVGDALGGPLEFMSDRQIRDAYGRVTDMIGGGWLNLKPGEVTDDTQMTLCVARGILDALEGDNGLDLVASVGQQFIAWADSKPKDIGGACSHSIAIAKGLGRIRWQGVPTAADWMEAARQTRRDGGRPVEGNGALMRTVYPGLYCKTKGAAEMQARAFAEMTHRGDKSTEACVLYTRMVYLLTESVGNFQDGDVADFLHECLKGTFYDGSVEAAATYAAGGYVVDSMSTAVSCLAHAQTFEEAVCAAANLGGDTDTNAAITGGLAGAWFGFSAIPARWVDALAPGLRQDLDILAAAAESHRNK